jgi:hypothetical protein
MDEAKHRRSVDPRSPSGPQPRTDRHGIHHDSRGQDEPVDKGRARQKTSGEQADDAAARQPPSPGQPAGGE